MCAIEMAISKVGSLSLLQGNLPNPGIKPRSPALQADSLPAEPQGKPEMAISMHFEFGCLLPCGACLICPSFLP